MMGAISLIGMFSFLDLGDTFLGADVLPQLPCIDWS